MNYSITLPEYKQLFPDLKNIATDPKDIASFATDPKDIGGKDTDPKAIGINDTVPTNPQEIDTNPQSIEEKILVCNNFFKHTNYNTQKLRIEQSTIIPEDKIIHLLISSPCGKYNKEVPVNRSVTKEGVLYLDLLDSKDLSYNHLCALSKVSKVYGCKKISVPKMFLRTMLEA